MRFERKTIEELLSASHRYQVPTYQRGYAWKQAQLTDFWDDLIEASKDEPLFLGTLILQQTNAAGLRQIVDGQQRITTICLLLLACRNLAKKINGPRPRRCQQCLPTKILLLVKRIN